MIIGAIRETAAGVRRAALVPTWSPRGHTEYCVKERS